MRITRHNGQCPLMYDRRNLQGKTRKTITIGMSYYITQHLNAQQNNYTERDIKFCQSTQQVTHTIAVLLTTYCPIWASGGKPAVEYVEQSTV